MNIFDLNFWFNLFRRKYTEQDLPTGWILAKNDLGHYKAFIGGHVTCVYDNISDVARDAIEMQKEIDLQTKANTWRQKNTEGKWWP